MKIIQIAAGLDALYALTDTGEIFRREEPEDMSHRLELDECEVVSAWAVVPSPLRAVSADEGKESA